MAQKSECRSVESSTGNYEPADGRVNLQSEIRDLECDGSRSWAAADGRGEAEAHRVGTAPVLTLAWTGYNF